MARYTKHARVTRLINKRKFRGDFFVKTTADVRQVAPSLTVKRPRERQKRESLEVNFEDQDTTFRIVKKPWEFMAKSREREIRSKSEFWREKKKGPSRRWISHAALLYIVSTLRHGSQSCGITFSLSETLYSFNRSHPPPRTPAQK